MSFLDFCAAHGIVIETMPPLGVWKRFKTEDKPKHRNGAVKYMGDVGFCQNHATMTEAAVWRPDESVVAPQRDESSIKAQRAAEAAKRVSAIRGAREFWAKARPLSRQHQYLERKGLSRIGCAELREHDGVLVVPVTGFGLMSLQTISADGEKRFWPGAPVKSGALILSRARSAVTCLVEGLATGLAVFQALPKSSVIVAFDCGNLLPVVERVKPTGAFVVCADNDHKTMAARGFNPGLDKAQNVADLLGCGVAFPKHIEGSDWADAMKEWGAGAAKRIEREVLAQAKYVINSSSPVP